jgi:hypothetical protein
MRRSACNTCELLELHNIGQRQQPVLVKRATIQACRSLQLRCSYLP